MYSTRHHRLNCAVAELWEQSAKFLFFEENWLKGNSEEKGLSSYNKVLHYLSIGFDFKQMQMLVSAAISLLFSTNVYHWKISLLQRTAKLLWTCAINILSTSPAHWTVLKSRGGACDCYEVHLPTCHRITSSYTPPNSSPMFFSGDHLIVHPHSHLLKARWVIQYEGEAITEPNGWLASVRPLGHEFSSNQSTQPLILDFRE